MNEHGPGRCSLLSDRSPSRSPDPAGAGRSPTQPTPGRQGPTGGARAGNPSAGEAPTGQAGAVETDWPALGARGGLGERSGLGVRAERPADAAAVHEVVTAAFRSPVQARLVTALRACSAHLPDLALVATVDGEVVGHVLATVAHVVPERAAESGGRQPGGGGRVVNLSPLSVAPSWQRRGVGAALVGELVARAEARGEAAVVLEGDPAYYGRLGFEPAARWGLRIDLPAWAPPEAAQVRRLAAHRPSLRGRVAYPAPFHEVAGR